MLNETRAQIRFRICDCEPQLPAAVADSLGSALIVCVQLAPVGLPRLLSIPDSWVMACRSCKSVKHCDLADGGGGRGASARSPLTPSVHSVLEVLRTRKTDGLKESDSRLGSAGVRFGKMDDHAQTGGWAVLSRQDSPGRNFWRALAGHAQQLGAAVCPVTPVTGFPRSAVVT